MTDQLHDDDEAQETSASAEAALGEAPVPGDDPYTALRREKDALQDRLLRTAAEFDNYRKRVERDRREQAESAKRGVKAIDAVGTDFDPRMHQAVSHDASPDHRDGEVMEEFRRGYTLGERLLRPSMVKVAKR
jgi:molecular chaperone GrpE